MIFIFYFLFIWISVKVSQLIEFKQLFPTSTLINFSLKAGVHIFFLQQTRFYNSNFDPKVSILLNSQCFKIPYLCSLMATLFHFPSFLSLSSRKLLFAPQQEQLKLIWETQELPTQKRFTVCACSNKKPRFEFLCLLFLYFCQFS